ncbi:MAG TPA: hypothetical protein VMA36_12000 [Candidatus Limnocylindria bacterium]|jgi:hypothetical protein|nr:hypothetical protein [Candidatus Limnocylindria bacterium]
MARDAAEEACVVRDETGRRSVLEATLEQPAANQSPQEQSRQEPVAQPTPHHRPLVVLVFVVLTEGSGGAGFERLFEGRIELLDLVLTRKLDALFLGKLLAGPALVRPLDLDNPPRWGLDRDDKLLRLNG